MLRGRSAKPCRAYWVNNGAKTGVNGAPDGAVLELLDRVEPIVRRTVRPNYVYIVTDISFEEGGVRLDSIPSLFTGESIRKHLSGCTKAVILAATLSGEADKLIHGGVSRGGLPLQRGYRTGLQQCGGRDFSAY